MSLRPIRAIPLLLVSLAGAQQGEPAPAAAADAPAQELGVEPPAAAPETKEERQRRIELLFDGALVGVRDAADFGETPGYRRLLENLASTPEEELHARAQRRLDIKAALAAPDEWRGEFVRLRAQVAGIRAERLANPLRGSEDAYRAFLTDGDDGGVVVDFLKPPPPIRIQKDVVDVEGIFFRTVRYENKGGQFREAPYLIARCLTQLDTEALPRNTTINSLGAWVVIVAGSLFLIVRITMVVRSSRGKRRDADDARAARSLREYAMAQLRANAQNKKPTLHPKP